MRLHLTERGMSGDDGEHYAWETDLDVADEDEAYVKGREFAKLTYAVARGLKDECKVLYDSADDDDGEPEPPAP